METSKTHKGQKLKELVDKNNYSYTQLAVDLDMTENNIYKIFKKPSLDSDFLEEMAIKFKVPVTYFYGGADSQEGIEYLKMVVAEQKRQIDDLRSDKEFLKDSLKKILNHSYEGGAPRDMGKPEVSADAGIAPSRNY